MTLDIRGSKKNTGISDNRFVVFEELVSNAIDSYLIRKDTDKDIEPLSIRFDVELYSLDLVSDDQIGVKVACTDNGAGLGEPQVKAFVTKDSTFKDDLKIKGIGKCFGSGRVQYFHFFEQLKIESVFKSDGKTFLRTLNVANNTKEISEGSFQTVGADGQPIQTIVTLTGLAKEAARRHFWNRNLPADFSASNLRHHIFITFLHRLVALKSVIGDFCIEVSTKLDDKEELQKINAEDLPEKRPVPDIPIVCSHGNDDNIGTHNLVVSQYEFFVDRNVAFEHEVALCANSSIVKSLTKSFLKVPKDRKTPLDGKYYLVLIESDYLERHVNVRRDNFNIPSSCSSSEMITKGPSMEDILESIEDFVLELLTPTDFDRDALIEETGVKFGISDRMLADTRVKVKYGDTAEKIAKRVLKKYQEDIIDDTSKIFDLKQQVLELDPRHSDFRDKVNEMSWKYTSTIKKMDMANLSQLVVRRSSMIEILKCAVNKLLSVQTGEGRKENEKVIHNIFFPMGKDSNDNIDHDIWILNEEYHYFDHIASDKALASIPWDDDESLFEADIDERLEELFKRNNEENSLKRPDIAIFNQEGAAIIIELKAPGVELQEHVQDLIEYARLLAAKSNGKINKFYGYLVGDSINENRLRGYTKFSSGKGYFGTDPVEDLNSRIQYGELYSEILFYEDFVDRAEQRLKVYKEKLGIG